MTTPSSIDAFKTLNQKANLYNKDGVGGLNESEKEAFLKAVVAKEDDGSYTLAEGKFTKKDALEFVKTYNREGGTIDREDMLKWTQGYNYRNNQSPYGLAETEIEYGTDTHGQGPASPRAQVRREAAAEESVEEVMYVDEQGNEIAPPAQTKKAAAPIRYDGYGSVNDANYYSEDYEAPKTQKRGLFNGKLKTFIEEKPEAAAGIALGIGLLGGFGLGRIGRGKVYQRGFEDGNQYAQYTQPDYNFYDYNFYNSGSRRRQNNYYDWDSYNWNPYGNGNCWWN